MRKVTPTVRLIAEPQIDWHQLYLGITDQVGQDTDWFNRALSQHGLVSDAEMLVEAAGRECYRSWQPGLNANVTKVREDTKEYLWSILHQGHGSVLEHANFTFMFSNVSRVFTHEFVRHRAGVAVSQESMRYVRLTDIPMWFPDWALEDDALMAKLIPYIEEGERLQAWMTEYFDLDNADMDFKKKKTSFMRRFAPSGHATNMIATINVRAIRHIMTMRTDVSAEEEIRLVCDQLGSIFVEKCPSFMQDFQVLTETRQWVPEFDKV